MAKPKRTPRKVAEAGPRPRQTAAQFEAQKAVQAHRTRMMRLAIPAIAPLVLLAVLSATRLMDTGQADQFDYWCAAALVGLTPVVISLLLAGSRSVRWSGYGLLILIDLSVMAVGVAYGSKSAWFWGAAVLFGAAAGYAVWAALQDRRVGENGGEKKE